MRSQNATEKIEVRLTPKQKVSIQRAAANRNMTMSAFVLAMLEKNVTHASEEPSVAEVAVRLPQPPKKAVVKERKAVEAGWVKVELDEGMYIVTVNGRLAGKVNTMAQISSLDDAYEGLSSIVNKKIMEMM